MQQWHQQLVPALLPGLAAVVLLLQLQRPAAQQPSEATPTQQEAWACWTCCETSVREPLLPPLLPLLLLLWGTLPAVLLQQPLPSQGARCSGCQPV